MKRDIIICALVAGLALTGCNKKPASQDPVDDRPMKTEQVDTVPTGPDMTLAEGYVPDRDPVKEAQSLAKQTIDLSRRMQNGEDVAEEQQKLNALMRKAADFYAQKGQDTQFQNELNIAVAREVSVLAAELKSQKAADSLNANKK